MKKNIRTLFFLLFIFYSNVFTQWFPLPEELHETWQVSWAIDAPDENNVVFTATFEDSPAGIFKLDYSELTLENITPFTERETVIDISMIDENNIWIATGEGRILFTSDGGDIWSIQFEDNLVTPFVNYIEMFDLNNGIAMADAIDYVNDPAVFLKTTDGGKSWISMNNNAFGGISGNIWRMVDFVNPNVGYFSASGTDVYDKIYKTIDGGENWNETNFQSDYGAIQILKFYDESIGLAYDINHTLDTDFGLIFRTIDGGENWETISLASNGRGQDFEFIPNDPSIVWFCDYYSLFFSTDTGKTWTMQSAPTDTLMGRDIVFTDENNGRLLCEDNGSYNILITNNNGGIVTDIKEYKEIEIPTQLRLEQNYPNPFNPVTTIKYSIELKVKSEKSKVKIYVYDVIGNEVAVLVDEQKSAGEYQVQFNGTNLSSGIYYYQLVVGDFVQTNKMILLK